jgi:tRNA (cytidine/uridine-2'-O-)-methyltransferase
MMADYNPPLTSGSQPTAPHYQATPQVNGGMALLPAQAPFTVVLVEPRIPQNVGNIARLCANTGASLWLVGSLGFIDSDKYLKRAGMDYLDKLVIQRTPQWEGVTEAHPNWTPFFLSSKGQRNHFTVSYPANSLLVFGSETHGLPSAFLASVAPQTVCIPMTANGRSLNLASSVAIILYEALRQTAVAAC